MTMGLLSTWTESVKQIRLIYGQNAYTRIVYAELHQTISVKLVPAEHNIHFASLGKLNSVADKVDQHLTQTARIPTKMNRHIRFQEAGKFEALALRPLREHFQTPMDRFLQIEIEFFKGELARFDF